MSEFEKKGFLEFQMVEILEMEEEIQNSGACNILFLIILHHQNLQVKKKHAIWIIFTGIIKFWMWKLHIVLIVLKILYT